MAFRLAANAGRQLLQSVTKVNGQRLMLCHHKAAVQRAAPKFEGMAVVNGEFKKIKLEDYKGKYVVFFFYPLDFTFVCPTEVLAFSDRLDEFKALNTEVIGASIDSHFSHLAWINTARKEGGLAGLRYPLLSDLSKQIATQYGVLNEPNGIALRGLFLIDPQGVVRHIQINDFPVGRSVDEVLRLIRAFQHVEKHGEVCPANWKQQGDPTIKPSPKESKDYFNKAA